VAILIGCEGDDGAQGAEGPAGPPGPPGSGGGGTALEVGTAEAITAEITGVTVDDETRATVSFDLRNELGQPLKALPAANIRFTIAQLQPGVGGAGSTWHAYVTRLDESTLQANAETANTDGAVFTDNGDGTYTYTFAKPLNGYAPDGVTYDGALTHRVGLELRSDDALELAASNNAPFDFLPATGATTDLPLTRNIVDNDTCFACHDRLEFHGGPRTDVAYCVTCHNPSSTDGQLPNNTVDMVVMIHKIHMGEKLANGYQITGFGNTVHEFGGPDGVVFPQDQRNCQTCHEEDDADTPQASNWRLQPYAKACGACHDTVNFETGENHSEENIVATDDQCVTCHGPDSEFGNGKWRVEVVHQIPEKLAGEKFQYNLLSVTNTEPGQMPVVRFSVTDPTNDDAPYNILTDAPFVAGGASRLSIDIGWSTSDYTNEDSLSAAGATGTPAQPIQINPLTSGTPATGPDAEGAFTSTSPTPLPDVDGSIAVAIEGHPGVDVTEDGTPDSIAVTSAIDFFAATDDVEPRRDIVNVQKCDDCHNQLSVHGSNRTDNVQVCAVCHNPNATDIFQRVDGSQCVTELGTDDSPIDLKYMIHAIHSGEVASYTVCGFGNRPHSFAELRYPGHLNNCEGCHITPGAEDTASYYPVDSSRVLATTVDAGADRGSAEGDIAWSPNTAVCSACHTSTVAEAHMLQNGGSKTLIKDADGTTPGAPPETCQLCHGPGRTADVKVLHGVDRFEFQAPAAEEP
jgi:OmcA/MtrC family decaheme c-type cytochrome